MSGVVTFVARLSQKDLLRKLYKRIFVKNIEEKDEMKNLNPISELFETLDKHAEILQVLNGLAYVFKHHGKAKSV